MPTLSLECSKKLHDLLGDTYGTERAWFKNDGEMGMALGWETVSFGWARETKGYERHPAPSFAELIRLLPKIAEKKGWIHWVQESDEPEKLAEVMEFTCWLYMKANTDEEGMAEVSKYLEKIL